MRRHRRSQGCARATGACAPAGAWATVLGGSGIWRLQRPIVRAAASRRRRAPAARKRRRARRAAARERRSCRSRRRRGCGWRRRRAGAAAVAARQPRDGARAACQRQWTQRAAHSNSGGTLGYSTVSTHTGFFASAGSPHAHRSLAPPPCAWKSGQCRTRAERIGVAALLGFALRCSAQPNLLGLEPAERGDERAALLPEGAQLRPQRKPKRCAALR
jgi:hypothetical protein